MCERAPPQATEDRSSSSAYLKVVVVHERGLGVVVVLGPFRDRMTASQFCAGSTWSPYCASGGFASTAAASSSSSAANDALIVVVSAAAGTISTVASTVLLESGSLECVGGLPPPNNAASPSSLPQQPTA